MKRRRFLAASGLAVGGTVGTAGCLGSATSAPPRESAVFESIHFADDGRTMVIELEDTPVVQSRARLDTQGALAPPAGGLAGLAPVGVARAQEDQKGARGRGTGGAADAPEGRNGRAKWRGGDYSEWWEKNEDKVTEYEADVVEVGGFYFGSTAQYSDDPPGPSPPDWDEFVPRPDKTNLWEPEYGEGWYRIGGRLRAANADHNFSWEYVDLEVRPVTPDTDAANATDGAGNETDVGNTTDAPGGSSAEPPLEVGTQWKVSAGL